jgi:hypothetical protein
MAPEHEARTRVLYDHESDQPRRRRHAVADWGVGEDIFDRMPSGRFGRAERRAEHHGRAESRTIVIERPVPAEEPHEAGEAWGAGEGWPADEPRAAEAPTADESPARRTVVISGHPDRLPAPRPARPPRTAIERVGARPDRIVAYAVALGFLLVLIAVLTTGQ